MKKEIPLFYPFIPANDIIREIKGTLKTRWLGQGPKVDLFEKRFGKAFKYQYPLMVNSGTSALELAYHLIGLKKGDEVIVPILDCTAGQMGLLRRGVKIVFADIGNDLNIDASNVEKLITAKTKAIVGVHLGGIPFSEKLHLVAKRHNIPLIVDAAQHMVSLKGDYICYSFQAIKHITTCDGGMLVLQDAETYQRAKDLRWFGIDRTKKEKNGYQAWKHRQMTFDITEPGYKMQPTDIDACFGLASLPYLPKILAHRKMLAKTYRHNLTKKCKVISGGSSWLFGILTDKRDELAEYLLSEGIDCNMVHLRNDIFNVFGGKRLDLPNINRLESLYLYLPLNMKVTVKDVEYICNKVNAFLEK